MVPIRILAASSVGTSDEGGDRLFLGVGRAGCQVAKCATKDYDKAIELNSRYTEAYNNRGVAKNDLGDHLGAITDFDKAIELDPQCVPAYCDRGRARLALGDATGAEDDFAKAAKLDPEFKRELS